MEKVILIKGEPILEVYQSQSGCYLFVTAKPYKKTSVLDSRVYKNDQVILGYVWKPDNPSKLEFGYFTEKEVELSDERAWKVPKSKWHLCPATEAEKTSESLEIRRKEKRVRTSPRSRLHNKKQGEVM